MTSYSDTWGKSFDDNFLSLSEIYGSSIKDVNGYCFRDRIEDDIRFAVFDIKFSNGDTFIVYNHDTGFTPSISFPNNKAGTDKMTSIVLAEEKASENKRLMLHIKDLKRQLEEAEDKLKHL